MTADEHMKAGDEAMQRAGSAANSHGVTAYSTLASAHFLAALVIIEDAR